MIRPISDEQLAGRNAALLRDIAGSAPKPSAMANVESAVTLADPSELALVLPYRRRRFRVPPVPYRHGLALDALLHELTDLETKPPANDNLRARLHVLEAAVGLMHALVRPVGWWDRLTWRWRANPFEGATAAELAELFRFFCGARTTTRVWWRAGLRAPDLRWRETWPPTSPSSSLRTPRGSTRPGRNGATRSAGAITSSATGA